MMTRRIFGHGFFALAAGGAALLLGSCGGYDRSSYRFKLTLEVETPEGIATGSSVYQVVAQNQKTLLPEGAARDWEVRGEAVAVDLPNGRTLFSLLKTKYRDLAVLSMEALDPVFKNDIVESAGRISRREGVANKAIVPSSKTVTDYKDGRKVEREIRLYPMLVTFTDIKNPQSIVEVDPGDLGASFGEGYALKAITAEITNEAVTTGIEETLGKDFFQKWGAIHKQELGKGSILENTYFDSLLGKLSRNDFASGVSK